MRTFKAYYEAHSPALSTRPEDVRFLATILDNAKNKDTPLVFADWLEEHGERLLPEYLRFKVERRWEMPRELIPLNNYFFQDVESYKSEEEPGRYQKLIDESREDGAIQYIAFMERPDYRKIWEPIYDSKSYKIDGNKIVRMFGQWDIDYTPKFRIFSYYAYANLPADIGPHNERVYGHHVYENPSVDLYWMMAMHALRQEGVIDD